LPCRSSRPSAGGAVVIDHHSRRALGVALFRKQPTSEQVRHFLGRIIAVLGAAPPGLKR
jgi:hypothetical protein